MTAAKKKPRVWAPKPTPETIASANKILDMAIQEKSLKNDADLSRLLDVQPCVISRIRNGNVRLTSETIIRLYQKAGLSMDVMLVARDGDL